MGLFGRSRPPCPRCMQTTTRRTFASPRQPFFLTKEHRVPTLWTAYRSALKQTLDLLRSQGSHARLGRSDEVLDVLRARWTAKKGWTSLKNSRSFINDELKKTALLRTAGEGNTASQELVSQDFSGIRARVARIAARKQANTVKFAEKRPMLTGGHVRPTLFNAPLPRLKPQPLKLSMMLRNRLRARERRREQHVELNVLKNDMEREAQFARGLGLDYAKDFTAVMAAHARKLEASFTREKQRADMKFSPELLLRIGDARKRREAHHRSKAAKRKTALSKGV